MDGLKIYKISKNSYEANRDSKLFSFMWNPTKYKIYNFKKLGVINDKHIQKGTLIKKPHIQMILQVQNKISDKKNETMKHVKIFENFLNEEINIFGDKWNIAKRFIDKYGKNPTPKELEEFEETDSNDPISKNVIEHYFVRQNMEVENIVRKQSDGKEIIINDTGVIKSIRDFGDDIGYEVEFPITLEHKSPYSEKKWSTDINSFTIFHTKDEKNIIKVF